MTLVYHPAAADELIQAGNYYEAQRRGLGRRFDSEFARALEKIVEAPARWPIQTRDVRRYRLHRFPYGVFYRIRQDTIEIVAVMHLSRRPDYWTDRL